MSIRAVVIFLLLFSVFLLSHAEAKSGSEYTIINTGIKAGGCWYDNTHFMVIKEQQATSGPESELEGLYFLDPNKPKELRRIDLSPIEPSLQKRIRTVSCQDQTIVFYLQNDESGLQQLYGLKIGSQPELIAEMRGGSVNLRGRYLINKFRRAGAVEAEGLQGIGIYEAHPDCGVKYVKPGLKTLCLDTWMESGWGLPSFRLTQYTWYETVKVRDKNGQEKWVPNPEPPLKLADGAELKHGYLLRDLENRIVQEIPVKQNIYRMDAVSFKPNPVGTYLYALCSKAGDYNPQVTFFGRVCRVNLFESDTHWEEVFSIQKELNERASLDALDVNDQGDVVVMRRANRVSPTLWKYDNRLASVSQLPLGQLTQDVGGVQLAPDGRTISYIDKGLLVFVRSYGGKR